MDNDYDYLFKLILIGNSGVGKTCLIRRYTDKTYNTSYISTIGVDFKIKTITQNDAKIKLQIWDTAGQERFRTITQSYYRGAHGIVVVFDITDEDSFKSVKEWIEEIRSHAEPSVEIILIGNKIDKEGEKVSDEKVDAFVRDYIKGSVYVKTSAKESVNVEKVFEDLASTLVKKEGTNRPILTAGKDLFKFKNAEDGTKKGGCC